MSDALRIPFHRSAPLLFILFLSISASTGCTGASTGMGQALKNTPSGQTADSAPVTGQPQEDDFLADPLGEADKSGPAAKAHPRSVLKTAFSQVGKPYRYGGSKPETGFDCSGFVKWVYSQYNIGLPRSSGDMMAAGTSISRNDLKPGDLVFFGKKKRITHVGIYTGNNKYIHSPRAGKTIQESNLDDRARGEYYAGARRLLKHDGRSATNNDQKSIWVEQAEREMAVAKASIGSGAAPAVTKASGAPKTAPVAAKASGATKAAPVMAKASGATKIVPAAAKVSSTPETVPVVAMASGTTEEAPSIVTAQAGEPDTVTHIVAAISTTDQTEVSVDDQPQPIQVAKADVQVEENRPVLINKTPAANPAVKKHQVTSGDTIYSLARKYGVTREALAKANSLEGEKAAMLKLGQTLTIPPATAKTASGQNLKKHKVASGDTLYDLARKYGVSADALAKANSLEGRQVANLKLGQTLVIPPKIQ